jgi:hypothetical protein
VKLGEEGEGVGDREKVLIFFALAGFFENFVYDS